MITESEVNNLRNLTITLLKKTFEQHQQLGEAGKTSSSLNAFGEMSLKADWEAEETIIQGCEEAGLPIIISSEEHSEVSLGESPRYRGILDGIDGTNAYKMASGPYGTMFGIFEGVNPRYEDYLAAGIIEYPSGRILIAARNQGGFVIDGEKITPATTSGKTNLRPTQTGIFIDGGFEFNRHFFEPKLQGFSSVYIGNIENKGQPWGVSSMYYFDLATGMTDVVLECTRKRNLEIAVAFGIITEAGGAMVDKNGRSIGTRKYLKFGQAINEHLPILSAATKTLAQQAAKRIQT